MPHCTQTPILGRCEGASRHGPMRQFRFSKVQPRKNHSYIYDKNLPKSDYGVQAQGEAAQGVFCAAPTMG